jgi:hypothetical protein
MIVSCRNDGAGEASIEYVGLVALVGLLLVAVIAAALAGPSPQGGRLLGQAIARRLVCAPKLRPVCHPNPLALAYGTPMAKLVRSLAPAPLALPAPDGLDLLPVDFRYCRRPSCAVASGGDRHLTAARRRTTAFTAVSDRRGGGGLSVDYWLYRPGLGWQRLRRHAGTAELAAASSLRLRQSDDPVLVPLETLAGRNHYAFAGGEEPPWRWRVAGRYPG